MKISFSKIILLTSFFSIVNSAWGKEIALTFDDAPRGDSQIYSGRERTAKVIQVLKNHNLQAAFFANSAKIPSSNGNERLRSYSAAGHIIANHTHSHPRLSSTPLNDYVSNIELADKELSKYSTFKKWFRYPFLNEGDTVEKRDGVRRFLTSQGYINGYVTVDNYDYFIDHLVQEVLKKGQKIVYERVCSMLVDLTWEEIEYYDEVAKKHIGNVRHVLLMHENDIEALCLDKLILTIQKKGWKIISPERAFSDPLLKNEPNTLYLSQGRVAAVAHAKTGIEFRSKWESTSALTKEFNRRNIVVK